jgi:hypothetical protein
VITTLNTPEDVMDAIVVYVDGRKENVTLTSFQHIQALVGGLVELATVRVDSALVPEGLYLIACNEDGCFTLPRNEHMLLRQVQVTSPRSKRASASLSGEGLKYSIISDPFRIHGTLVLMPPLFDIDQLSYKEPTHKEQA